MATYRKTKSGEWVAYGPADELTATFEARDNGVYRRRLRIDKRDGSHDLAIITRVGKPFAVDGVQMAYAYLDHAGIRRYDAAGKLKESGRVSREQSAARRDGDPTWWE